MVKNDVTSRPDLLGESDISDTSEDNSTADSRLREALQLIRVIVRFHRCARSALQSESGGWSIALF